MEPNGPILKKTIVTVAVMLGAWLAFTGVVSTAAVLITSHAVGAPESADTSSSAPSSGSADDKSGAPLDKTAKRPAPQRI